ncbi:hypothetical protein RI129_010344 [Pyrocoelia pectoralis]|uniref:ZAD domain-containing protein n=1 Tax=Pyrocoelia pectoralis TaxID=417401 RepID=A0AAN7ZGZ8_9COLE
MNPTNTKCIVPNCKSTAGVPFPKDYELKEKWLEALQLQNSLVKQGSFVCFVHFSPSDLRDDVNSKSRRSVHRLKRGAVPSISITEGCQSDASEDDSSLQTSEVESEESLMCRACMSDKNLFTHLTDCMEDDITIVSALNTCISALNVSEEDQLPKYICRSCLATLKVVYKFRKKCLTSDSIMKMYHFGGERKRSTTSDDEHFVKKFKSTEEGVDVNSSEFEVVYEDSTSRADEDIATLQQDEVVAKPELGIDDIERNMKEIHGDVIENIKCVEEVESVVDDVEKSVDDDEQNVSVEDILTTLEEGTRENYSEKSGVRPMKKIVIKSKFPTKYKRPVSVPDFKLPPGVKIKPLQAYTKPGVYTAVTRCGVYESMFIQADDYLFEIGLSKGDMRQLRCTLPTCSAQAKQQILENGSSSDEVEVLTTHNHPAPDEVTKKKQMFFCVMRKKMQTDRTLNIRIIYEDAVIQDPEIREVVPLRNVINEICRHQLMHKTKPVTSFEEFYRTIELETYDKLHFTHGSQQFYQEKFLIREDSSMAVLFANVETIQMVTMSTVMYVDASFKIDTSEDFKYQLLTVLVWVEESYYPILFALINKKSQLIFRQIFIYLRDRLAPELRPQEIVTDYEANLYYALTETYVDSTIGGSVFYYTQNIYKKICSLNLSRDLETNSYFRNIYHMLLMLPLLPVNTILDGLNSIELEAKNLNIADLTRPIFDHVRTQWILNVTPELFCVHKLENRINENVIAPFKKLRDFLLLTKGKMHKTSITITHIIEKIIELEAFLSSTYSRVDKKSFGRDLSSYQKKNVLRAWQFIEDHPKIEISNFFSKVLGYIKCMENQLWIWGFYRYDGDTDDILINASHFSIVNGVITENLLEEEAQEEYFEYMEEQDSTIVMEAVIDQDGVLQTNEEVTETVETEPNKDVKQFESAYLKYVYQ